MYIIFDLEFNNDIAPFRISGRNNTPCPFEIIQIGAIKLDAELNTAGTFNRYIKPTFHSEMNPFIAELTGITAESLVNEESFPDVYSAFVEFIDENSSVFCTWGMSDINGLFKNVKSHELNQKLLPNLVINLQHYASVYLNISRKKQLGLQQAVELFNISKQYSFHNALHDAFYTAEIFKKIYNPSIKPAVYDPAKTKNRPEYRKKEIDTGKLIQQFEKMYGRKMTKEEQGIIELAYKMGRTHQFLK